MHFSFAYCTSIFLDNIQVAKDFFFINGRTSIINIENSSDIDIEKVLFQWSASVGVLLDGSCENSAFVLDKVIYPIINTNVS